MESDPLCTFVFACSRELYAFPFVEEGNADVPHAGQGPASLQNGVGKEQPFADRGSGARCQAYVGPELAGASNASGTCRCRRRNSFSLASKSCHREVVDPPRKVSNAARATSHATATRIAGLAGRPTPLYTQSNPSEVWPNAVEAIPIPLGWPKLAQVLIYPNRGLHSEKFCVPRSGTLPEQSSTPQTQPNARPAPRGPSCPSWSTSRTTTSLPGPRQPSA